MVGNPEWMKLGEPDPQFVAFMKKGGPMVAAAPTTSLPERRAFFKRMKKASNEKSFPNNDGLVIEESFISARDGHQIPIRTYKPSQHPSTGSPLVVLFHGGGFTLGDLESEEGTCRSFCLQLGCTVVNVEYRLAPENPFPIPVNDAYDAVKWAAANASKLGASPSAGFLLGAISSGANLAVVSATLARDDGMSPPLTGLWLAAPSVLSMKNPPAHLVPELQSFEQCKNSPVLNSESWKTMLESYKPDETSRLFNLYSETDPVSRAGLPPLYLQVCGMDLFRDEELCFERELREEHGTKTKLQVYSGLPHGFWTFFPELGMTDRWARDTLDGMRWLLEVGRQEK
ncbi:Alpha/Beta hydrolase protein [Xylaria intraflava]|nr:Alpha/Beta hydrolase protein [Xylaria intraflava]